MTAAETPLTRDIRPGEKPLGLREYESRGGYSALRKALHEMTPDEVIEEVKASNLRGRGGAGFPTGLKWGFVPKKDETSTQRFVVANGDEMEPGTFKDRVLMEGNPHQLLEGVILAAYAIEATLAYVFIRWAYHPAFNNLRAAALEAREAGYIGTDILGSGFNLRVHIHGSAGRYMCGEETGLLSSLEGRPARARAKPPFPPVVGLWGKPTIVQNIETLCNVPHIVRNGAELVPRSEPDRRRRNQALRGERKGEQPRHLRASHGHTDPGDHRGARPAGCRTECSSEAFCPVAHRPRFSSTNTSIFRWTTVTSSRPEAVSARAR